MERAMYRFDSTGDLQHAKSHVHGTRLERRTQAKLARQREEEKRKMEERSDQLDTSQKEALLEKFKLDQVKISAFIIVERTTVNV